MRAMLREISTILVIRITCDFRYMKHAPKELAIVEPKAGANQTGQNPVSSSVAPRRNGFKSPAGKDKSQNRKEYLRSLEADAQAFVKGFQRAKMIGAEANALHRKFKDVVESLRPVFERVRFGFAHLKKDETVMGERTGPEWAKRYIGISYDWLCRCLNPPKAGTVPLPDGTVVVIPSAAAGRGTEAAHTEENAELLTVDQPLPPMPTADNPGWTDDEYVKACVRFIASSLRPLESDPKRFHRVALAIAREINRGGRGLRRSWNGKPRSPRKSRLHLDRNRSKG
jgi:hypothetical protein